MDWIIYALIALLLVEAAVLFAIPKTRGVRVTKLVQAAPGALFQLVSNLESAPAWYPTCVSAEKVSGRDGPARKQKLLLKQGEQVRPVEQQVTTWIDNRQYGWKSHPEEGPLEEDRTVFTFTELDEGTEIEILGEATARSLFAKLFVNFGYPAQRRAEYEKMANALAQTATKQ